MAHKLGLILGLFSLTSLIGYSQDTLTTPKQKLEEIVISGQYNPQSINKAINNVTIVNRQRIENLGAVTLADALNQVMNISILPNAKSGRSSVKMFGLDGQYFTILIDNIPMISDEGFGNNTDLTQINLDDVERIEIVEGAMGVDYGANAVTGIINIITKKSNIHDWNVRAFIQEESVGKEYNLKNKGKHVQGLTLSHNINDNLFASLSYTHNDFKGWYDDRKGFTYYGDENKRGHEWLPKNQNNVKGLLTYHKDSYRVFYKFEYFNERMKNYNKLFEVNEDPTFDTSDPIALDRINNTKRWSNILNTVGNVNDLFRFDLSFSYQKQEKEVDLYRYRIRYDEKFDRSKYRTESREVFFSRGTFSDFIKWERAKFQVGYEITENKGYSSMTESFGETPQRKSIGSYDFYASSEINVLPKLTLRPGYRLMTSNLFDSQHQFNVVAKYILPGDYELRATVGTSPRLPNYEELYTYFVDVNHDLQGNPNLTPEKGKTFFMNIKKSIELGNDVEVSTNLTGRYLVVDDKIDVIEVVSPEGLKFKYENVDKYRNLGITFLNQLSWNNLDLGIGFTLSGAAQQIYGAPDATDKFLYTPEVTANVSYRLPKWNTSLSLYYKYNGEETKYKMESDLTGDYYIKGKQESYSWLDFTIRQPFLDRKLVTTLGVRNIFDITDIKSSTSSGTAHAGGASSIPLGYGRSFFVKLQYDLGF
ncbi:MULTISPECIES: TonB-dependent receptor plug domain-containing protein [Myroides]|uniref:TonB-dependent receptor plug domain-containing protein n=1 Tax=Myroides albus TaxID=2562892 RepID=A0A6I3LGP2_9FLAO|nr:MULTISPECIES: TonB-dependent receptor plug domain-containing protein [Myroides]MTG97373.1 TonB-dependent receptor plug domain-containing protein [Myroides albus]MVX34340.1 TonB-dependent receptor plug domain-containing protein [Myroides sp. LoEW2-1]UVD80541.1 TonB-dependent receptor plug domain-containing protein [Myroides albus]